MVTGTRAPHASSRLLGQSDSLLTLRVLGPEHAGRILRIRSPKCVIGSHPSCTLRLRGAGIQPFHCLILRGAAGTFIRRWSPETCLNGQAFGESVLRTGDHLAIGPIELEVLDATPTPDQAPRIEPTDAPSTVHRIAASDSPDSTQRSDRSAEPSDDGAIKQLQEQLERERQDRESAREQWQQERQQLQAKLASRTADFDEQRRQLTEQCDQIRKDLQRSQSERQQIDQLLAERDRQAAEVAEKAEQIQQLQQQLADSKEQSERLAAERERLAAEAGAAQERAQTLQDEFESQRQTLTQQYDSVKQDLQQSQSERQQIDALAAERDGQAAEAAEKEEQIRQLQQQLADAKEANDAAVRSTSSQETIDCLRKELQQTREQHQRARDEWHADRVNLENALAARGEALDQNEVDHKEAMEEAEGLIHSLQQEGKQLLLQLEEARQTIREDTDRCKKLEAALAATTVPPNVDAIRQTSQMPDRIGALESTPGEQSERPARPSARVTMHMTPRDLLSAINDEDEDASAVEAPELESTAAVTERQVGSDPQPEDGGDAADEAGADQPAGAERVTVRAAMDQIAAGPDQADGSEDSAVQQDSVPPDVTLALGPDLQPEQPVAAVEDDPPRSEESTTQQDSVPPDVTLALGPDFQPEQPVAAVGDDPPAQQTQQLSADELMIQTPHGGETSDEAADDEGMIQSYMDRLLERVGRKSRDNVIPSDRATSPTVPRQTRPAEEDVRSTPASETEATSSAPEPKKEGKPAGSELPARRTSAPELAADLLAMREVANDSARYAIKSSEQRRDCAAAASGMLVATICLVTSGAVLALSPKLLCVQSLGGVVGLSFGTLWFLHGLRGLIASQRLRRRS